MDTRLTPAGSPAGSLWRGPLANLAQWPVRRKLLLLVLLPLGVVLPLLGLILLAWGNTAVDRMLITKVRSDLAVAQGYFDRVLGEVRASALSVADAHALHQVLGNVPGGRLGEAEGAALVALLQAYKQREHLDFINLRAPDGRLIATDSGLATRTDLRSPAFVAATGRRGTSAVEVLQAGELALLAPALARQVPVPLLDTRNAAPTERRTEDRAMVVLATADVVASARPGTGDAAAARIGQIQAGVLLNRNLGFIDHINDIVYPEGALPFGSQGTATLFLDDVRISTNVRLFGTDPSNPRDPASRAIGTRVSQTVRDAVLGRGNTWLDRAFVVDDWYVSAYQPLSDGAGQRVGMLYVGYLERPFTLLKYGVLASIGAIFFAVMIGAAWVSLRAARAIFRPIEQMAHTMRRVELGELDARTGPVAQHDEVGQLAGHLDHLLDTLHDKTGALQRLNSELDAKVAERTEALEAAQGQLLRSEKMAAVGQLTASIAHEVNNPIAVIQGNLDLLRELLDADTAARVHPELKLIDQQVERMRLIVTKLLQFARPTEYAGYIEQVNTSTALDDCLVLVAHLLSSGHITLVRDLSTTRRVGINGPELQQVLVNLLVNAIQAMPQGGELRLSSRNWQADDGADGVQIEVADTGSGLPAELLPRLFQAFTTGRSEGNGLGLWISRSIVERYGGQVVAANRGGGAQGAVFTVSLRCEPTESARA